MSKIELEGFLSIEAEEGKKYIIEQYKDVFDLAKDLNRFSMTFLRQQRMEEEINHKFVINVLLLRLTENFQGAILMLERGMLPEAKVIARAMLESIFILVALQKKPNLLNCYFDQYHDGYKKALKAALQFKNKHLRAEVKRHNFEKLYVEKKKELTGKQLNILAPKNWAEKAEMEDFYNLYYVTYSNSIHSNLVALDDHFDSSPQQVNLSFGPSIRDLYDVLKCGIYVLMNAINFTSLAGGKDISMILDKYKSNLSILDEQYLNKDEF